MNALRRYEYKLHSEKKTKIEKSRIFANFKNPFFTFLKFSLSIYAPLVL